MNHNQRLISFCLVPQVTTETVEQALNRAGVKSGNKGSDAALAAIEMVNLLKQMPRA